MEALDAARRFEGRIVELVAEPGVGKSRLTEELRSRAGEARVLGVECQEYEASTPYFAFRTIFREVLASDDEQHDELERRLRERIETTAPHLVAWLPLLGLVLGLEIPDTEDTAALGDEFRKTRLQEASSELLGMVLLEPTLLLFEDAHWMDDASADLLRHLTGGLENRPWLIVATRRDRPSGFAAPPESNPVVIELEPLAPEQAAALVVAATEELPLLPHEIEALTERAGGNPLFLNELLTATRRGAAIEELPDSVETLMMAQIDRLSPPDRRVLRCAAVIGTSFAQDLVDAALAPDAPGRDAWQRLSEFLVEDQDGHFRFRHALVRDAAYEGLPYRRRREVHDRVGETVEARAGERAEDEAELLSLHFFHAHDYDKAWRYSRIAGDRAQAMYANVEAATFFERALESARRLPGLEPAESARASEALGDVRVRLGEFERAERAFTTARHRAGPDPLEQSRLLLKQAAVTYWQGSYPQTIRRVNRGLQPLQGLESSEASAQRAKLYTRYGVVRRRQGRRIEAIQWLTRAIDEADKAGAQDALAHAYYNLDLIYVELGRSDEAVHSPQALAIYEGLGDLWQQAAIHNNLGMLAYFEGRWDDAVRGYETAREMYERAGDRWTASYAMCNSAEILSDQGRMDEAEGLLRGALRIARASRSSAHIAGVSAYLGRHLARAGIFGEARALLTEAREEFERSGDRGEVFSTDARIAECLALEGDAEPAFELATAALDRAASLEGVQMWVPILHRVRGWALMQLGRHEEAAAELNESLTAARANGADYEAAVTLVALARLPREPAAALVQGASEIFERLGVVSTAEPLVASTSFG
jgi:tetratricopeptide (TPR) repeat protein